MSIKCHDTRRHWPLRAGLALAGALWLCAIPAGASTPVASGFSVSVTLFNFPEKTGQCDRETQAGSVGSTVTINCSTVETRDPIRYLLHVFRARALVGTVDGEMEAGTVTSWRVVNARNREYLEMTVGW